MEKQIKVGVMGCANIAQRSVIPAFINHPAFSLVAVASRTKEKADSFSTRFNCKGLVGYDQLLKEDIDLVYVPLPTGFHEEWVAKCLLAGKHVLVEKSFGMNYASSMKMLAIAQEKKLVAMENFMFPHHSQHKFLLELVRNETIGTVRNFRASFGFPPLAADNFRYNLEAGGGALLDAGAYTIKAAQVILGNDLEFLSASQTRNAAGVDIAGSAHFMFNKKVPVQLSWGFDNFYQCGVEIWGNKGKITTNRTFTAAPGFQPTIRLETTQRAEDFLLSTDDHFANILTALNTRITQAEYTDSANEVASQSFFISQIQDHAKQYECH